jgi:hypothetical protein
LAQRREHQREPSDLLAGTGRATEAEPLLTEALAIRQKSYASGDRRTALAESHLGECLLTLGRHADAEPLLVSGYEALKAAKGVPPAELNRALDRLIKLYEAWGKPEKATEWRAKRDQLHKPADEPMGK